MNSIKNLTLFLLLACVQGIALAQPNSNNSLLELAHDIAHPNFVRQEEKQLFLSPDNDATSVYVPKLFQAVAQTGDTTLGQLLDRLEGNPFIGRAGGTSLIWIDAAAKTDLGMTVSRKGAYRTASSGFSVTTVADGIAKFLVNRAKEELSIAFFRQFKQDLVNDKYLSQLFPNTTATLLLIDDEVYQFSRYLESLRESFIRDFKVMPTNLNSYLKDNSIIKDPRYQILSEESLELSQLIINGTVPEEIIDYLAYRGPVQDTTRIKALSAAHKDQFINMAAGFQTSGLVSHSLYGNSGSYLDPIQVSEYLNDHNTRLIYLGLLWQHSGNIVFSNDSTLRSYLGKMAIDTKPLTDFTRLVVKFANNAQGAENQAVASKKAQESGDTVGYEPYYEFFTSLLEIFETGITIKKSIAGLNNQSTSLEDTLFLGIRHLNDLNFDIRQKHYAAAINDLMYVLRIFLPDLDNGVRKKIFNYGQFIATVATAENSDEVAAAIDVVALPPGSSRVKKQNYFSAAINAYTGANFGMERLTNNTQGTVVGLSAPIGFTVSWKLKNKTNPKKSPGSFSFFAPLIDVGALATYRFKDSLSSDLPDLAWSNLLAPGLYGVYGFPNDLPISFGFGAQRGPNLRTISSSTADIKASGWRYGIFLAVDIPVFNLYVQGKKGDR